MVSWGGGVTCHPHSWISSFPRPPTGPRPGLILPCHVLPHQAPLHPLHTHRQNIFITKSFFIESWIRDRNRECTGGHTPIGRGVRCRLTPCLLGHWKVRSAPRPWLWRWMPGCSGVGVATSWSWLPGQAAVSPKPPPEGSHPPAQRNSRLLR